MANGDNTKDMKDMEGLTFKKDEKPYLVFPCTKCGQYTYAKLTQKGKKCLRCGRSHQLEKMKNVGEIISGMSNAVETVKQRQNEPAREELGRDPDFESKNSFRKGFVSDFEPQNSGDHESKDVDGSKDMSAYENFKGILLSKTKHFPTFPKYVLELLAEEAGISKKEMKAFVRKLLKEGFLNAKYGNSFRLTRKR